ncbi:MAG TPA: filamentous hemagglutinin N-terminal domain-containing protein [Pseudomonadales bacterium]|nr:filamentous hemagglutinin N-terminal domain-containing protein [Pseudomonadales bacterium]
MFLLTWIACRFQANANPTGGTVSQGQATFNTSGSHFTINQSSANAVINWQSFNIGAGETTTFNQPSATSITWNQIGGASPSQILGNLNANGYVVLQNANGFYMGGQAAITARGLVMTTAVTPNLNLSSSGPWSFGTPPPAAKIQNYGQINITGGGTAYLIAADIVNGGTISAPNGHIGLFDGETVLVSLSPNGQGLSAQVTLPQGSVDNEGNLTANGGSVVAQAQMVNQNGVIQANSAQNVNGTIELVGDNVTLGSSSSIIATGDSTVSSASGGGSVQIQGGTSFSDASGSAINVSGASQGGNAGQISISAPQMAALNSVLNAQAAIGYLNGTLSINTANITLNSGGSPVAGALALDVNALSSGLSQINLQASDDITLTSGAKWQLSTPMGMSLQAGNAININGMVIADGSSISMTAADVNQNGTVQANSIQNANGMIKLDASDTVNLGAGSTTSAEGNNQTMGGGITVQAGNVINNSGTVTADGSSISMTASAVNQNGTVQANSIQNVNGTIHLNGSSSIALGANSTISAAGDSTAIGGSAGGSVQIQGGTSFADTGSSSINVSGASQGGSAGQISISAPTVDLHGILEANSVKSADGVVAIDANQALTLEAGSAIYADAGSITLKAPAVDQAGTLRANSVGNANGVVEIYASQSLVLEGSSTINVNGDSSSATASPGGFVVLNAGNAYSDTASSTISASGNAAGGQGGIVEILAPTPIQTTVSGAFAYLVNPYDMTLSGNATGTSYDANHNLDANFNLNDLATYSQIDLQALDNVTLNSNWQLADRTAPANLSITARNGIILSPGWGIDAGQNWTVSLTANNGIAVNSAANLQAGDDIILNGILQLPDETAPVTFGLIAGNSIILGSGISAGQNWSLNLTAGTGFVPTVAQPTPASGNDGIYLNGDAFIQGQNGNINLWAANEVQVGWAGQAQLPGQVNLGIGGITTFNGGNISVTTQYGDVNTGSNPYGFSYEIASPYTFTDVRLGGISTGAGGNVNINAGGNVISYSPSGTTSSDAGTGAFGTTQPGNVTITAGGSVYGHYVLADGLGTITAGQDAGVSAGNNFFALSLINGGWSVTANGNIYLQEVRNPNGLFNNVQPTTRHQTSTPYLFTYGAQDFVNLTAGNGVYLSTESSTLPRLTVAPVQVIYPSILNITAGAGGVTLDGNVTLFPSPYQNLDITTTDSGSFVGIADASGNIPELLMSDSSQTEWVTSQSFSDTDNGSVLPNELLNPNPVLIDISGYLGVIPPDPDPNHPTQAVGAGLNIITTKETDIRVGQSMINCGFSGQNLQASDITSITVAGQIFNSSPYSFVYGISIPSLPATDVPAGIANTWSTLLSLAIDPTILNGLTPPANVPPSQYLSYVLQNAGLFPPAANGKLVIQTLGFVYDPATGRLGFAGPMSSSINSLLTASSTFTVLHLVNGQPVIDPATGKFKTDTVNWVDSSTITSLYNASQGTPSPSMGQLGYQIGGPGQFNITAGSISLGNTYGILSDGVVQAEGGNRYGNLASITAVGATINVLVTGSQQISDPLQPAGTDNPYESPLDMLTSTIAALGGGGVNVTCTGGSMDLGAQELLNIPRNVGAGIYTTGGGNVNIIAQGDVNIDGSRVGTYNGGNILVESLGGTVNIGSGSSTVNDVYVSYVDPVTGLAESYPEAAFGSGIIANTLVPAIPGESVWPPNVAALPGNITVLAPRGNIIASLSGVLQVSLNGNVTAGPTITLEAGTPAGGDWNSKEPPVYVGNINTGKSGVIGGELIVHATGNIDGELISRQNADITVGQNFSGTVLSGGQTSLDAGGNVQGTIVGIGSVSVTGGNITASVLSQNANVGGVQSDTLGSSASATSSSQSAAQQGNSQSKQQIAADETPQQDNKKKKPQIQKVSHVTVILANVK